ncbi:MAG: TPR repeat-containing protein [uncultured Aureispira sp.]|uniref:TPR repeat-containing protein n=1 Tax=uncultured Aureispira sp. TaxID=1331704 RepID=A0A6S6TSG2_9BACT|nr:MAG: TPR repeat-containing protein [uncultured Aureispira sp.]
MKYLFLFFILFFLHQNSFGQKRFPSFFVEEDLIALDSLSDDAYRKGDYKGAIVYGKTLLKKIELRSGTQDSSYAYFVNYLGFMNMHMGNYAVAEKLLLQSKRIYTNIYGEEHQEVLNSLSGLAGLYKAMGHYKKAEKVLLKVKKINAKLVGTEHQAYAVTLASLGGLYYCTGHYEEAEALYLETKRIHVKVYGAIHEECSNVLANLASLYIVTNRYEEAESLYLEALSIDEKTRGENHPSYALKLNNLAVLYFRMGRDEEGEIACLKAEKIQENTLGVEHSQYANSLTILASSYQKQGRKKEAVVLFLKARALLKKTLGVNHPKYGQVLLDLAKVYFEMGWYYDALLLELESLEITTNRLGVEHQDYAACLNALGQTYLKLNQMPKARDFLAKALQATSGLNISVVITEEWKDSLITANYFSIAHINQALISLNHLYLLLEKEAPKSRQAKQLILSKLAHGLFDKIRKLHTNSTSKLRMLGRSEKWTSRGLYLLGQAGQVEEAFDLAEASKSVLLLEATKSEKAYRLGDLHDSLMLKEKQLFKERDQLQANIIKKRPKVEQDSLRVLLNIVHQNIRSFVGELEENNPNYAQLKYKNNNAKLREIQALLEPKTALLEYVVTDSILYLFYMDKHKYKMLPQPIRRGRLKTQIHQLYSALRDYALFVNQEEKSYEAYTRPAHWFYKNLIAPIIADAVDINHFIIVPDGELGYLPFETFLIQPAKQGAPNYKDLEYLVKHYKISYNYSATLWKENKQRKKTRNNGQMLAMAGNYDLQLDSSKKHFRLSNYYRSRSGLQPLDAAQIEVHVLSEEFQGYFGFDTGASERLFKEKAGDYAVIHLAMHGCLDSKHPILSSLIFTEDGDSLENSLLQAYEISNLKLNADLVVLSACETGYGTFEKGNGIASLARSFMYAGASSMVVTLWPVNDYVTSEIMKELYSNLSNGMTKSEALQQAKLKFMARASVIGQHPAFWSPFVLIGNDEPIQIMRKSHAFFWAMVLAALAIVTIGGVWFWKKRS